MTERVLTLCADDFGLSAPISRGIASLAQAQRLSAISCIGNAPAWADNAPLLRGLPGSVCIGLHFNLSEGRPLSAELARVWPTLPALGKLIALAHLRQLPLAALRCEWHAQIAAFSQASCAAPQMIDGHQHVHHLPGIREIVLEGVEALAPRPAVRSTAPLLGPGFAFKRWVIEASGGRALRQELQRRRLRHNASLLGAYDFKTRDYRRLMQQWLAAVPAEGGLLFCHPSEASADAIGPARSRELAYLASEAFDADLRQARVRLGAAWLNETSTPG